MDSAVWGLGWRVEESELISWVGREESVLRGENSREEDMEALELRFWGGLRGSRRGS